jgi:hypothetical protein
MDSYQNSIPGQVLHNIHDGDIVVDDNVVNNHNNNKKWRLFRSVFPVSILFIAAMVFMGSPVDHVAFRTASNEEVSLLQGSGSFVASKAQADAQPPVVPNYADQPQPDYNGEGRYDWQKCKTSNDPDCWKNEGERVGGYWHNFGLRMKTFWMNFRTAIKDFFTGSKGASNTDASPAVEEETSVKKSKKKHKTNTTTEVDEATPVAP